MRKLYWMLAAAAVTPLVMIVGIYAYKLGTPNLDTNPTSWGLFGDYVGGTLGAFYGLLAFVGVLITVAVQREQLDLLKEQAHLDELQRLLGTIASGIDAQLSSDPSMPTETMRHQARLRANRFSIFNILAAVGTQAINSGELGKSLAPFVYKDAIASLEADLPTIGVELDQLVWCLHEYKRSGGSPQVAAFYKRRYAPVVCWMHALGQLHSAAVEQHFDPKEIAVALRQDVPQSSPLARSLFDEIAEQMPDLLRAIKADLAHEGAQYIRHVFILPTPGTSLGGSRQGHFIYYESEHDALREKLNALERAEFVADIAEHATPHYELQDVFVTLLRSWPG